MKEGHIFLMYSLSIFEVQWPSTTDFKKYCINTVFPHIRPAGIIFCMVFNMGIIRNAGIIQGRALYEEIW